MEQGDEQKAAVEELFALTEQLLLNAELSPNDEKLRRGREGGMPCGEPF